MIDPSVTPVWALYTSSDDAAIIYACLPSYNDKRNLPTRMWGEGGIWTSRSRWALTKEELIEKEDILPECGKCKKPFSTNWCDPYPKLLKERNLCFSCNLWIHEIIPNYGKVGHVVIGSTTYFYDPKSPIVKDDGRFLGHGGREFAIRLKDGTLVRTNNLWCGGQIPARFLEDMPDNATFEKIPAPVGHGQGYLG